MGQRHIWTAAGSGAPRRFGFCARGTHGAGVSSAIARRSTAPSRLSTLRSAATEDGEDGPAQSKAADEQFRQGEMGSH